MESISECRNYCIYTMSGSNVGTKTINMIYSKFLTLYKSHNFAPFYQPRRSRTRCKKITFGATTFVIKVAAANVVFIVNICYKWESMGNYNKSK